MAVKVQAFDGTRERRVVTALITCPEVLGRVAGRWEGNMLPSRWGNILGQLCVDHYRRHRKAPGRLIEVLVASWAEGRDDRATIELIASFLSGLSDEYERSDPPNPGFMADMATALIRDTRLAHLADAIRGDLDTGRPERAEEHIAKYRRIDLGAGSKEDLFLDGDALDDAFASGPEALVTYPGDLGLFFGDELARDSFVAFQAPEKAGKTFQLLDIAYTALCQRRKVAFFSVGDMTLRQIKLRFLARAARHPYKAKGGKWPTSVTYPTSIRPPAEGLLPAITDGKPLTFDAPLDIATARKAVSRVMRTKVRSSRSHFGLAVYPNSSVNVDGIDSALRQWSLQHEWEPDVVVIDYADILADQPGSHTLSARDRVNETWKALRRLSQERHCLLVTATQSDAGAYGRATMDRRNFSEDHRKLAHVTGLVGINVTDEEKENGVCRLNWIVKREGDYSSRRCVHVAQCLPVANPCVLSTF